MVNYVDQSGMPKQDPTAAPDEFRAAPTIPTSPFAPTGQASVDRGLPPVWLLTEDQSLPPPPPYGGGIVEAGRPATPRRRWWYALLAVALLVVLGIGYVIGTAFAHPAAAPTGHTITIGATSAPAITLSSSTMSLQQSVETVTQAVEPSVVEITSTGGQQEAIGSGDILTADGYIVTNDHVVQGFTSFTVTLSNGSSQPAQLVGQDAPDDLAVLKIAATNLRPIAIGDSSSVQVGEFAIVVGNPLGLRQSATFGIVSALNRTASEAPSGPASELTGLIQTSAPINPGNSGGALVNLAGQLIGIPTLGAIDPSSGAAANGIGYAIASNRVSYVATQLIQFGHVNSTGLGFIGIRGESVTPDVAAAQNLSVQSGVLVNGFANDAAGQSPAQQAGVQAGDVITAVDGQSVATNDDLAAALLSKSPGTRVSLTVVRGNSQLTISVTLGERPPNA